MGLERDPNNTGYGHTAEGVASIRPPDGIVLIDYLDAVGGAHPRDARPRSRRTTSIEWSTADGTRR